MNHKFVLEHIRRKQCIVLLSQLGLDQVLPAPEANAVMIVTSPELLCRVSLVLYIIDTKEEFVIENLGPASAVRTLPSNSQITTVLGDISIGTFAAPPQLGAQTRGIIDIHGDVILAIIPARYRAQLLDLLAQTTANTMFTQSASKSSEHLESSCVEGVLESNTSIETVQPKTNTSLQEVVSTEDPLVPNPSKTYLNRKIGSQIPYQALHGTYVPVQKTPAINSIAQETTVATSLLASEDGTAGSSRSSTFILKPLKKTSVVCHQQTNLRWTSLKMARIS